MDAGELLESFLGQKKRERRGHVITRHSGILLHTMISTLTVMRLEGFTISMRLIRSLASRDTCEGNGKYRPDLIFESKLPALEPSKGSLPVSIAYNMTPADHTSVAYPLYGLP